MSDTTIDSEVHQPVIAIPEEDETTERVVSPSEFIVDAIGVLSSSRCDFITYGATFDMDEKGKMLAEVRGTNEPNPYRGRGIRKVQVGTVMLTKGSYNNRVANKRERKGLTPDNWRKGEGWFNVVCLDDGTPTPFVVNKQDINDDGSIREGAEVYLYVALRDKTAASSPTDDRNDINRVSTVRIESQYVDRAGRPIALPDNVLPARSENTNQGLKRDPVRVITPKVSNLTYIAGGGIVWRII